MATTYRRWPQHTGDGHNLPIPKHDARPYRSIQRAPAFSPRKAHDEVVSEGVDNKRGRINPGRSPTPIGNVGAQSLALQFCLAWAGTRPRVRCRRVFSRVDRPSPACSGRCRAGSSRVRPVSSQRPSSGWLGGCRARWCPDGGSQLRRRSGPPRWRPDPVCRFRRRRR